MITNILRGILMKSTTACVWFACKTQGKAALSVGSRLLFSPDMGTIIVSLTFLKWSINIKMWLWHNALHKREEHKNKQLVPKITAVSPRHAEDFKFNFQVLLQVCGTSRNDWIWKYWLGQHHPTSYWRVSFSDALWLAGNDHTSSPGRNDCNDLYFLLHFAVLLLPQVSGLSRSLHTYCWCMFCHVHCAVSFCCLLQSPQCIFYCQWLKPF